MDSWTVGKGEPSGVHLSHSHGPRRGVSLRQGMTFTHSFTPSLASNTDGGLTGGRLRIHRESAGLQCPVLRLKTCSGPTITCQATYKGTCLALFLSALEDL